MSNARSNAPSIALCNAGRTDGLTKNPSPYQLRLSSSDARALERDDDEVS